VKQLVCLALVLQISGYVTGAPVPNWLGLATLAGRDAIQLSEGCSAVVPGLNVVVDDGGGLQVVGQRDACTIVSDIHIDDTPCATNPAGVCDVAYS
jgi:hypothetical protein